MSDWWNQLQTTETRLRTARELIESQECTPSCLLALAQHGDCICPCDGMFHGALADAEFSEPDASGGWWSSHRNLLTRSRVPVVRDVTEENRTYREQMRRNGYAAWIYRRGSTYTVGFDEWEITKPSPNPRHELAYALVRFRRAQGAWGGNNAGAWGIGSRDEAVVIANLFMDVSLIPEALPLIGGAG